MGANGIRGKRSGQLRAKGSLAQLAGSCDTLSSDLAARIGRRLDVLQAARELSDIDAHGLNLHRLKGERHGEWAISVSGNWRITFGFAKGEVVDVNLEDYH